MIECIVRGGQRMTCIKQSRRKKVIINCTYYDSVFQIIKTAVCTGRYLQKHGPRTITSVNRHETKNKEKEYNEPQERSS